jgi:hypothetical protein
MIKKYLFFMFVVIFSIFFCTSTFAVFGNDSLNVPNDKDIVLNFNGFQEITFDINDSTTIFFNFYETNGWINNSLDIYTLDDGQIKGKLKVDGEDKGEFVLNSGEEKTINLTQKTPFIVISNYIFTKDDISKAVIKMRLPFISIGVQPNVGNPEAKLIDDVVLEGEKENISLKLLLVAVIILLIILILVTKILRKK